MHITTAPTETSTCTGAPAGKPGRPEWATRALAAATTVGTNIRRFVNTDPAGAATLAGVFVGTVLMVGLVISLFVALVNWVVFGTPVTDVATWVPATQVITTPIGHWLSTHTAGLPLSAQAAGWIWGATGFLLFDAACCRHRGAQLLWPLYGAATAAMVWAGTDTAAHRPVAVGLLAVAWSVLSLLALRGTRDPRSTRSEPVDRSPATRP